MKKRLIAVSIQTLLLLSACSGGGSSQNAVAGGTPQAVPATQNIATTADIGSSGFSPTQQQAALFAIPSQNAVIAIDVSHQTTAPASRMIAGTSTGIHAPVDIASGPNGEAVVLNAQSAQTGDTTTLRGNGVVLDRNASGNVAPLSTFSTNFAKITNLANGPTGLVLAWGPGDEGRASQIYALNGVDLTEQGLAPAITGFRRFLALYGLATAPDGNVAAIDSDFGDFGGFGFDEESMSIAGNAQFLSLNSNIPGDAQIQMPFSVADFQFDPNDGNLYVLAGDTPTVSCPTGTHFTLRVYPRANFALLKPLKIVSFSSDLKTVTHIRFDKKGALYALGGAANGDILVDVYADPSTSGSSQIQPVRSFDLESILKAYQTVGFGVQVQ